MRLIEILNRLTDGGLTGRIVGTAHTSRASPHVELVTDDGRARIEVVPSRIAGRVNVIARRTRRGTWNRTLDRLLARASAELTQAGLDIDESYVSRMRNAGVSA